MKNGNSMLISRVKQVYLYIFSNFNEEWNSEVKKVLSKEEFLIFSEMKNYDKMMLVVKELLLEEGAFISYWKEDSNNDITTVYSVDELKAHLGNLNDEDFENIVIQVNFDNQEKDYQITLNDFDAVYNKNEFIMNLLHNTR